MRTRTQQNVHILLLAKREKCIQVVIRVDLAKIELSGCSLMNAPRHVGADRSKTHLADAIEYHAPSKTVEPPVMDATAHQKLRLAIEIEPFVADRQCHVICVFFGVKPRGSSAFLRYRDAHPCRHRSGSGW